MSSGGCLTLEDLIADLERPRIGVTRRKRDGQSAKPLLPQPLLTQPLLWNPNLSAEPNPGLAITGTVVSAECADAALAESRRALARELYPEDMSVDIFA